MRCYPDITVTRSGGTAQCNHCFAQNWAKRQGPHDSASAPYKPDIYAVDFGPSVVRLCPECLRMLREQIDAALGDESKREE